MPLKTYLICSLLLLIFLGCQQNNEIVIDKENYTLSYPRHLELMAPVEGAEFLLLTKADNKNDDFKENINLVIQDLSLPNQTLASYVDLSIAQIKEEGGNIISNEFINNEKPTYQRVIYNLTLNQFDLQFLQHVYLHQNKIYLLTFTAEVSEFNQYKDEMESIMKSFKLKNY